MMKLILMTSVILCAGIAAITIAGANRDRIEAPQLKICITESGTGIPCSVQDPRPNLYGTQWLIKTINGEPAVAGFFTPSLSFGDNIIGVSSGCRSFRADFLDADKPRRFEVVVEPLIAIACPENLEVQEVTLAEVVGSATDIFINEAKQLTLSSPEGASLVAVPMPKVQP